MTVLEEFLSLQSMKNVLQELSVSVLSLAIGKLMMFGFADLIPDG
jgi:hypothetical protein